MVLSMSGNESYASVKAGGCRFLLKEGVLKLDDARAFVQEEVLVSGRREQDTFGVQAAALQKGGMDVQGEGTEGTRRTHREPNTAELVEPCCRGLEEGLPVKAG